MLKTESKLDRKKEEKEKRPGVGNRGKGRKIKQKQEINERR